MVIWPNAQTVSSRIFLRWPNYLSYQPLIKPNIRFHSPPMQHHSFHSNSPPLLISKSHIATKITTQNITILQSLFITFTGLFLIFLLVVLIIIILNFSLLLQEIRLLLSHTGLALLEGQLLTVEPGKENLQFENLNTFHR